MRPKAVSERQRRPVLLRFQEELGGVKYFTAVYPDVALAPACISCHNKHKDSPRNDFKIGEVMGGVVIRIPL
jgi:hypothetical protein